MNDLENTIPTLLNVKQHGNEDMLNQFKTEADELQTTEDNNTRPRDVQHDIPSIFTETNSNTSVNNNSSGIDTQDFSEAMQSISNQVIENKLDDSDLKIKIDKAVKNAMIGIETHLKQQLYAKFNV